MTTQISQRRLKHDAVKHIRKYGLSLPALARHLAIQESSVRPWRRSISHERDGRGNAAQFDYSDLQSRLSSHVYTLYLNYAFLVKSGVFTVAALSLYNILTAPREQFWTGLIIFWLASFVFSLVTVSAWTRGAILATGRASMFDVIIPIGMAIPEYLLFISIDPKYSTGASLSWLGTPWTIWYLWFAFHALGAWALITNRMMQTLVDDDYRPELRPLVRQHVDWMRQDRIGAIISMAVALVIFGATTKYAALPYNILQWSYADVGHQMIGIIIICLGIVLVRNAHSRYTIIERFRPAHR